MCKVEEKTNTHPAYHAGKEVMVQRHWNALEIPGVRKNNYTGDGN